MHLFQVFEDEFLALLFGVGGCVVGVHLKQMASGGRGVTAGRRRCANRQRSQQAVERGFFDVFRNLLALGEERYRQTRPQGGFEQRAGALYFIEMGKQEFGGGECREAVDGSKLDARLDCGR